MITAAGEMLFAFSDIHPLFGTSCASDPAARMSVWATSSWTDHRGWQAALLLLPCSPTPILSSIAAFHCCTLVF